MIRLSFGAPALLVAMLTVTTAGAGCQRGAAGACRENVDCPAGYDCAGSVCVRRQRMRFGVDARPAPVVPAPSTPASDAGVAARPETAPPATPPSPAAPPPPPAPAHAPAPPLPGDRLPMWKERLKNS